MECILRLSSVRNDGFINRKNGRYSTEILTGNRTTFTAIYQFTSRGQREFRALRTAIVGYQFPTKSENQQIDR